MINKIKRIEVHSQGVMDHIEITIAVKDRDDEENKIEQIFTNQKLMELVETKLEYFTEKNNHYYMTDKERIEFELLKTILKETKDEN